MNTLKNEIASLLRHALTALAGIGTLLASRGCIADEDAAAVDAAGLGMTEAIIVVVVAIVARVLISVMGKMKWPGSGNSPLWMMMTAGSLPLLGFVAAALTVVSCADYQGPRFVFGLEGEDARVSYDSDAGGTVRVDARIPRVRGTK